MKTQPNTPDIRGYARCVEVSGCISWDIDRDVIRGRKFDFRRKFLPEGLSLVQRLEFLDAGERLLMSQIQGRTYANIFRLVERFVGAKDLELSRTHAPGDHATFEARARFTREQLKHQELFRRVEELIGEGMPPGYRFAPVSEDVAALVLGKSTWAVLALTCQVELVTQVHYRQSIAPDAELSNLFKDVFFFHWKDELQHAILDQMEWRREDARLSAAERDNSVSDLIELIHGVDALLVVQAPADADYFAGHCKRRFTAGELDRLHAGLLRAYRWQYIVSGAQDPHFAELLGKLVNADQAARISSELAPMLQ
jgi:hypothetical protein